MPLIVNFLLKWGKKYLSKWVLPLLAIIFLNDALMTLIYFTGYILPFNHIFFFPAGLPALCKKNILQINSHLLELNTQVQTELLPFADILL